MIEHKVKVAGDAKLMTKFVIEERHNPSQGMWRLYRRWLWTYTRCSRIMLTVTPVVAKRAQLRTYTCCGGVEAQCSPWPDWWDFDPSSDGNSPTASDVAISIFHSSKRDTEKHWPEKDRLWPAQVSSASDLVWKLCMGYIISRRSRALAAAWVGVRPPSKWYCQCCMPNLPSALPVLYAYPFSSIPQTVWPPSQLHRQYFTTTF